MFCVCAGKKNIVFVHIPGCANRRKKLIGGVYTHDGRGERVSKWDCSEKESWDMSKEEKVRGRAGR